MGSLTRNRTGGMRTGVSFGYRGKEEEEKGGLRYGLTGPGAGAGDSAVITNWNEHNSSDELDD